MIFCLFKIVYYLSALRRLIFNREAISYAFGVLEEYQSDQLISDFVHLIYYLMFKSILDILEIFIKLTYCGATLEFFQTSVKNSFISFTSLYKAIDQTLFLFVLIFTIAKSYYLLLSAISQIYIHYSDLFAC